MKHQIRIAAIFLMLVLLVVSIQTNASSNIFSYVSGKTGFVVVGQETIIKIVGSFEGVNVSRRVKLIEIRLKRIAAGNDFNAANLVMTERNNKVGLTYNDQWLVIADPQSAYSQKVTQFELAELWRANLVRVFGETQDYTVSEEIIGVASWYGREFRGRKTANGERFDETKYTAAHRSLPFGTKVRVTNLENNLSVIVTINDRGPWTKNRIIDLSWAAAKAIGIKGIGRVKLEVLN
ncbi:MAG TPA: septal ring lytic transglycosylase RlpA family protein [Bacillota bacterium]|nr:septal ring lytic transglycosylase RlpA family protein [Bacillota bacterium]